MQLYNQHTLIIHYILLKTRQNIELTNISLSFLQKYVVNHNSCQQDQYRSYQLKHTRISTSCEILTLTEETYNVLKPLSAQ